MDGGAEALRVGSQKKEGGGVTDRSELEERGGG